MGNFPIDLVWKIRFFSLVRNFMGELFFCDGSATEFSIHEVWLRVQLADCMYYDVTMAEY